MTWITLKTQNRSFQCFVLLLLALLFAVTTQALPIQLQRRQSFFRCSGWGAGCGHLDYSFQPHASNRAQIKTHPFKPPKTSKSESRSVPESSGSAGKWRDYGLHFLFTSGNSFFLFTSTCNSFSFYIG